MTLDPASILPDDQRTQWLAKQRSWLGILAGQALNQQFDRKFDPSDVVQQTMLAAWQGWESMRNDGDEARRNWLRGILAHQVAQMVRHYQGTQKRDLKRERSIDESLALSSQRLKDLLIDAGPSPSAAASSEEQTTLLADALEQLPEDYRQVIILRNLEELPHSEVAKRMGRDVKAVRMLWMRALAALSKRVTSERVSSKTHQNRKRSETCDS